MSIKNLAEDLKKLTPFPNMPGEIFDALRELLPMVAMELLITGKNGEFGLKKKKTGGAEGWALLGGFIGLNETFEEACQRIAQKELEVGIDHLKFLRVYNWLEGGMRPAKGHAVTLLFQCRTKTISDQLVYFTKIPDGTLQHHRVMLRDHMRL